MDPYDSGPVGGIFMSPQRNALAMSMVMVYIWAVGNVVTLALVLYLINRIELDEGAPPEEPMASEGGS